MAKVRWRQAGPDDPIYTGGFVISSHPARADREEEKPVHPRVHPPVYKKASATGASSKLKTGGT